MTRTRPAVIAMAAILVWATLYMGASGQAEAPGPAGATPGCMTYIANTTDCLTYVTADSKLTKPAEGCCPELAGLVDSNPVCLCYLLGGDNGFGVQIDVTRALKLPSLCSVTTPSVSLCSDIGIPVGASMAPTAAPTSTQSSISPPSDPSMSLSPGAGSGSGSAPAGEVSSEASSITSKALAMFFSFVVAIISV